MLPELFKVPLTGLTIKSYGLMMVVGFMCAVALIRRLSRDITPSPHLITNAALYSLIAGVVGARLFYVLHHYDQFDGSFVSFFAVWKGGLELLGGVVLAIAVIFSFLLYHRLPVRRYLDILAIGLMLALVFGRIGCFLNGCCFGKPTSLPWGVRFPYGSIPYSSQIYSNPERDRAEAQLKLPAEFFDKSGALKPYEQLTAEQKEQVGKGPYRALAIHPTQLYSSAKAGLLCLILYLFRRRSQKLESANSAKRLFAKPGSTFALMFILYGIARFFMEFIRDDNPFEYGWWIIYKGGTVSQSLGIYLVILGLVLMLVFEKMKPHKPAVTGPRQAKRLV